MTDSQKLFQKTDYQVLRKNKGYDVLHKGKVVRSFGEFYLALANVASSLNKSESNTVIAPQADDPYLPAYECEPGTVFVTSKTIGSIVADCDKLVRESMTQPSRTFEEIREGIKQALVPFQVTYVDELGHTYTDVQKNGDLIRREIVYPDRVEQWIKQDDNDKWIRRIPAQRSYEVMDCYPPMPSLASLAKGKVCSEELRDDLGKRLYRD